MPPSGAPRPIARWDHFRRPPYIKCEGTVTAGPLFCCPGGSTCPTGASPRMSPPAWLEGDRRPPPGHAARSRPSPTQGGRAGNNGPSLPGILFPPYVKTDPHHQQKASFVPPGPSRRASFDRNSLLAAVAGSYVAIARPAGSVGQAASLSPCPMFQLRNRGLERASWQLALRNQPPGFVSGPVPLRMCLRMCPDRIFPAQREFALRVRTDDSRVGDVEICREMLDKTTCPVPVPCPVPALTGNHVRSRTLGVAEAHSRSTISVVHAGMAPAVARRARIATGRETRRYFHSATKWWFEQDRFSTPPLSCPFVARTELRRRNRRALWLAQGLKKHRCRRPLDAERERQEPRPSTKKCQAPHEGPRCECSCRAYRAWRMLTSAVRRKPPLEIEKRGSTTSCNYATCQMACFPGSQRSVSLRGSRRMLGQELRSRRDMDTL